MISLQDAAQPEAVSPLKDILSLLDLRDATAGGEIATARDTW
jgi:hypothetical protein